MQHSSNVLTRHCLSWENTRSIALVCVKLTPVVSPQGLEPGGAPRHSLLSHPGTLPAAGREQSPATQHAFGLPKPARAPPCPHSPLLARPCGFVLLRWKQCGIPRCHAAGAGVLPALGISPKVTQSSPCSVTALIKSRCPAPPGERPIRDTEKRQAPFRKAVCCPPSPQDPSSQSKARSGPFLAQRVDQAAPNLVFTWSYLDSSIPQLGDELQPLFKELLLGRGHQHLCLRCPDLFLRGLERGQGSKDATDIQRYERPYEQDRSPPQAQEFSGEEHQAQ